MATKSRRIIDGDGHVAEDSAAIIARMPEAYREKARLQPFMCSTDFPHEVNGETCKKELAELIDKKELSDSDTEAILYKNAVTFYGLSSRRPQSV